ncbi:hypothetical protein ACFT5B_03765 [Luteimicrobium sp. NPDC057192]|uniref:hypothetical protein n=1 Tax=Luteimicrobium sp. NPDC057192 TaxID=3346042 RepID=UPI00363B90D9
MFKGTTDQTADTPEVSHYDRLSDELKALIDARPVFDREEAANALDPREVVDGEPLTIAEARDVVEYFVPTTPAPPSFETPAWAVNVGEWEWSGGEWSRWSYGKPVSFTGERGEVVELRAEIWQNVSSDGHDQKVSLDLPFESLDSPEECRAMAKALLDVADTFESA